MDHMMPRMDGIETVSLIRKMGNVNPYFRNVPIIALTANAVIGTREMFMENGFCDFLSKPINIEKLNKILEKWIPAEKQEIAIEISGKHGKSDTLGILNDIELAGVDIKKGIAMSCGAVDNYSWTLGIFQRENRVKINEIKACLEENNISLYKTHIHALKSACANIGAIELSKAAEILEMAGQRGDWDFIKMHNKKFLIDLETVIDAIDKVISAQIIENKNNTVDIDSLKTGLSELKAAMISYDIAVVNDAAKSLKALSQRAGSADVIGKILQCKLHGEYEEAVLLIDDLLVRIQEGNYT
jgi:HPt (histidine-containing phosphotransfer) domain-containing protein